MTEVPSIEELSHEAKALHPNAEVSLAMVAHFDPSVLGDAVEEVMEEKYHSAVSLESTKNIYEAELDSARTEATEALRLAAVDMTKAEERAAALQGKIALSNSIRSLQDRLAFPMRFLATGLAALAIGVGSTVYTMEARPDRYPNVGAKQARNFKEIYTRSPVAIGILFGIMGGVAGNALGSTLSGREARRRARRAIARQDQIS